MKSTTGLFLIFLSLNIYGQHKYDHYDWKKYDTIPFREDRVQSFNNYEIQSRVFYPITQSNADIELRIYTHLMTYNFGRIRIIQIFNDSVIARQIYYNYLEQSSYKDKDEYLGKTSFNYDVRRHIRDNKSPISKDSLVRYLIEQKIFLLDDISTFYKSKNAENFKRPPDDCLDCFDSVLCEMKVNRKFRNFHIWGDNTSGYIEANPNIEYFKITSKLLRLFNEIFNNKNLRK